MHQEGETGKTRKIEDKKKSMATESEDTLLGRRADLSRISQQF